jgi:hypothetical protein
MAAGFISAEVVTSALYVDALRSSVVFQQKSFAISRRNNRELQRTILEFFGYASFR